MTQRLFLAEGPQAVREALALRGCVVELFATHTLVERHGELPAAAARQSVPVRRCDDDAIAALTGSRNPQGLVAMCRFVDVPVTEALDGGSSLVVVAAHVREPGNAGSLIRCADAVGAGAVIFAGSSVDPYNDKSVRASAGSLFHVPIVVGGTVPATAELLRASRFRVLAADAGGSCSLDEAARRGDLLGKVAWVFGNEAWGFPAEERALADAVVAVPLYGRAESLNVATAAAVCLYATAWAQRADDATGSVSS